MANQASSAQADLAPDPTLDVLSTLDAALTEFLDRATADMVALDPGLQPLARVARDAVLNGGKRMRPTFGYWGWRGLVGPDEPLAPVLPALAALELLHAFALVHDDVMDASDLRRGRPTAHRALAHLHRQQLMRGNAVRFGASGAILAGDLCLVWADQMISEAAVADQVKLTVRKTYDRMRIEAISGQFLDILGESAPSWTVAQALDTAALKTASYTVTRPLLYGAALSGVMPDEAGGAHRSLREAYTRYGLAVGVAFQLRDDLLGLYGETPVTGKPVGDDQAAAKPTVLLQLARSMATRAQAAQLERALRPRRRRNTTRIADIISATGAKAKVEQMISERVDAARDVLAAAPMDAQARDALEAMAAAAGWRAA
jgi:geranylgeranyl diphosphate synthase type I